MQIAWTKYKKNNNIGKLVKTRTPFWHDMVNYCLRNVRQRIFFSRRIAFVFHPRVFQRFRSKILFQTCTMTLFYPRSNSKDPDHTFEKSPIHRNTQYLIFQLKIATISRVSEIFHVVDHVSVDYSWLSFESTRTIVIHLIGNVLLIRKRDFFMMSSGSSYAQEH